MTVLETSFVIDILQNVPAALKLLDKLQGTESAIYVTSPTVMELWEGALRSKLSDKEKERVDGLLASVAVLHFDVRAAKRAAELRFELSQKGTPVELRDVMIASVTLVNGEMIVTSDSDYARIPGLKVLKY